MRKYRWIFPERDKVEQAQKLAEEWEVDPAVAMLLLRRKISSFEEATHFFRPKMEDLHDPLLMQDMKKAAERICQAIQAQEKIMVYGDYDVDGTTAVSLVASVLKHLKADFITYIPDRYKEGYGLSAAGITFAEEEACQLIVALDCGIKAYESAQLAKEKKLDLIICDHHLPGDYLPNAFAILDPKRKDCAYPFKELSGCGVGFKLMQAVVELMGEDKSILWEQMDLLTLSIGADIVPIVGENRVLARMGLERMQKNSRPGIQALMNMAKRKVKTIDDVVFALGPRINAAGRIAHGNLAVELLTTKDAARAEELAYQVNELNEQRRNLDSHITEDALRQILQKQEADAWSTVVHHDDWHKGVIGIVASRLIETHYRPTVVLTGKGDVLAGSARSVNGFDLYEALDECREHLIQFGGHMYAAGMTLKRDQLENFREKFEEIARNKLRPEQRTPYLEIDCQLGLTDLNLKFLRILNRMSPFGPHNMKPVFVSRGLEITANTRAVGADESHLKIEVRDPKSGLSMDGIAFRMAHLMEQGLKVGENVSVAFHLEENDWNNVIRPQLHVLDIDIQGEKE